MKIARVSRVAIVWAMCLQLLVAPWAVAIESSEQNNDLLVTSDEVGETSIKSEGTNYQDDKLTTDGIDPSLVDSSDVNNTTNIQPLGKESVKTDGETQPNEDVDSRSGIIITQVQARSKDNASSKARSETQRQIVAARLPH